MIIMIYLLPDHDHDHNHDLSSTWSNRTDRQLLETMAERVEKSWRYFSWWKRWWLTNWWMIMANCKTGQSDKGWQNIVTKEILWWILCMVGNWGLLWFCSLRNWGETPPNCGGLSCGGENMFLLLKWWFMSMWSSPLSAGSSSPSFLFSCWRLSSWHSPWKTLLWPSAPPGWSPPSQVPRLTVRIVGWEPDYCTD